MHLLPLLALLVLAIAPGAVAQSVNWVQYINPTDRDDVAYGVCVIGDYLAVVGKADGQGFVALLDRATGEVVKMWVGERGWLFNCLSVGDRLYAVGKSGVYIFNEELVVLKQVEADWIPVAISFDGSYLYLAGGIEKDVDGDGDSEWLWRIEKRTLDLDLVTYREFYREWDDVYRDFSIIYDIAMNPATGELWTVGWRYLVNKTRGKIDLDYSLLVIFDRGLSVKRVVEFQLWHEDYLGDLYGVCFDDDGNAYVIGSDGVAKIDRNGHVLAVNRDVEREKIACIGGRVYVFGAIYVGKYRRHVFYVLDKDLNLMGKQILSKGVEADS